MGRFDSAVYLDWRRRVRCKRSSIAAVCTTLVFFVAGCTKQTTRGEAFHSVIDEVDRIDISWQEEPVPVGYETGKIVVLVRGREYFNYKSGAVMDRLPRDLLKHGSKDEVQRRYYKTAVDAIHGDLPLPVRASSSHDVTTVAVLRWSTDQVASYTNGERAFRIVCAIAYVDVLHEKVMLGPTVYFEPETPESKMVGYDIYAPVDRTRLVDAIISAKAAQ